MNKEEELKIKLKESSEKLEDAFKEYKESFQKLYDSYISKTEPTEPTKSDQIQKAIQMRLEEYNQQECFKDKRNKYNQQSKNVAEAMQKARNKELNKRN